MNITGVNDFFSPRLHMYVHLQVLNNVKCLSISGGEEDKVPFFSGSSLNVSWHMAPMPNFAIGNINTYGPVRLNGEEFSSWAGRQPPTPTLFPLLMSLSLFVAPSIFQCCLSFSCWFPVFHSRPSFMSRRDSPSLPSIIFTRLLYLCSGSE